MKKRSPNTIEELDNEGYHKTCYPPLSEIRKFSLIEFLSKNNQTKYKQSPNCSKNEIEHLLNDPNYFNFKLKNFHMQLRPKGHLAKSPSTEIVLGGKQENATRKFEDPVKFARDNLISTTMGFTMTRNAFMFEVFRDTMQKLFESGILLKSNGESWYEKIYDHVYKNDIVYVKEGKLVVLAWEHLHAGFYIWAAAVGICMMIFIAEIIVFNYQKQFVRSIKVVDLRE